MKVEVPHGNEYRIRPKKASRAVEELKRNPDAWFGEGEIGQIFDLSDRAGVEVLESVRGSRTS